jgi:hypothetical protein
MVSGFSPAAGQKNGQFYRKRNSKKENIEYRIMNVECRRNEFCLFKKTERSETILRNSAVRCSVRVKFHTSAASGRERPV